MHTLSRSLIDLNRAGVGLMELVFEPDLENGEEAAALVNELIRILTLIQTCNCKMAGKIQNSFYFKFCKIKFLILFLYRGFAESRR